MNADHQITELHYLRQYMANNNKLGKLSMWVVYNHPLDYPDSYVARLHEVCAAQDTVATGSIIITPDLETLRHILALELHLTPLCRDPSDDPKIVETWL